MPARTVRWLLPGLGTLALLAGGCWDRTDVERRALVTGVAVDRVAGATGIPDTSEPEPGETVRRVRYRLAIEWPFAPAITMTSGAAEGAGGGKGAPVAMILRNTATTLAEADREFNNVIYRIPFYGYTQALLIGEDTARQGIRPVTDFFMRSFAANWRMNVYVTRGEAAPLLSTRQAVGDLTGVYLGRLSKKGLHRTARTADVTLFDVMKGLVTPGAVLIPRVTPAGPLLKVAGAAVVKQGRMVAWLGEIESRSAWLINGEVRGGAIVLAAPWDPRLPLTVDVIHVRSKKAVRLAGDRPVFDVRIDITGSLMEKEDTKDSYEAPVIRRMEAALAGTVRAQAEAVLAKTRAMGADVFEFHRLLERRFPGRWRVLRDDWGGAYSRSDARVHVTAHIRRVGAVH